MTVAAPLLTKSPLVAIPKMSDETYRLLREYIYQQTGIYFQDNKKYLLEGRLGKRLQVLTISSFEQYLQLIKYGTRRNEELRHFYDAITINETFFFRNEPQFEALEYTLVPAILAARSPGDGRSCASGVRPAPPVKRRTPLP